MKQLIVVLLFLMFASAWIGWIYWWFKRSNKILQDWAAGSGYQIVSSKHCWFWRGPFVFRSTHGQTVYYVTVADRDGMRRRGWVRCGGFWLGLCSDKASVEWED